MLAVVLLTTEALEELGLFDGPPGKKFRKEPVVTPWSASE